MAENEKKVEGNEVDISKLGIREKVTKLIDPYNAKNFSWIRLVKTNKEEATACFKAYQEFQQKERTKIQAEEEKNQLFSTLAQNQSQKQIIDYIIAGERAEKENESDMIEIVDEKVLRDEMAEKEIPAEEIELKIDEKIKEKINQWEKSRREKLETKDVESLRKVMKEKVMETEVISRSNKFYADVALGYMCYKKDVDERVFDPDPASPKFITKVLRDEAIYWQINTAYYDFMNILTLPQKKIRKLTKRGGDFFTSTKSGKNTENSHTTVH